MSTTDNEPALVGGRYRLGTLLGVGATACVYAAIDVTADPTDVRAARVAVKMLHPHLSVDAAVRDAFLTEARTVQRLAHPNVVAVIASGVHNGGGIELAWMAIERVDGGSVADRVNARGPLPPSEAATIATGLLAALDIAHRAGLVHRDVTPANVLLTVPPMQGVQSDDVRLADFGISALRGATAVDPDSSETLRVVGTAHYVSPEHAQGRPISTAGDLYQAGAVLHFLLTGHPPFTRDTAADVLAAHVNAPAPAPSALVPSAHPLDKVVARALAKNPAARYRNARDFADAVAENACSIPRLHIPASAEPRLFPLATTRVLPAAATRPLNYLDSDPPPEVAHAGAPVAPGAGLVAGLGVLAIVGVALWGVATASVGPATGAAPSSSPSPSPSSSPAPSQAPPTPTTPATSPAAVVMVVTVPDLTGALTDAEATLAASGLVLGDTSSVDSPDEEGHFLGQEPAAGTVVEVGSAVSVTVASGYNTVPDVTGLTVSSATVLLHDSGFSTASDRADVTANDTVRGTRPGAPMLLRVGATVTMLVASSAAPSPSPSVTPTPTPEAR